MGRTVDTSSSEEMLDNSGDRLETPGSYHFMVLLMKDQEMAYSDDHVDGYSAQLQVIHGEHAGKTMGVTLYDPNASNKDGGAFLRKKQTSFFIAANLMTPAQIGTSVEIDETQAAGAQLIATTKLGQVSEKTGKQYLEIDGLKNYHVDDPRAKDVPKNREELAAINEAYRRLDPAFFEPIMPKAPGKGGGGSSGPKVDLEGL